VLRYKRVKGSVGIGKKTGRADEAVAKKIVEEMTGPPDEVQIDPDDNFKQKKVQGVSSMRQPVSRKVIRHEDGTVERVRASGDEKKQQANKTTETRSKAQSEALSPLKIALSTPKNEGGPRPPTLSPDALERKMKQLGL
jgi:hypothetical protein